MAGEVKIDYAAVYSKIAELRECLRSGIDDAESLLTHAQTILERVDGTVNAELQSVLALTRRKVDVTEETMVRLLETIESAAMQVEVREARLAAQFSVGMAGAFGSIGGAIGLGAALSAFAAANAGAGRGIGGAMNPMFNNGLNGLSGARLGIVNGSASTLFGGGIMGLSGVNLSRVNGSMNSVFSNGLSSQNAMTLPLIASGGFRRNDFMPFSLQNGNAFSNIGLNNAAVRPGLFASTGAGAMGRASSPLFANNNSLFANGRAGSFGGLGMMGAGTLGLGRVNGNAGFANRMDSNLFNRNLQPLRSTSEQLNRIAAEATLKRLFTRNGELNWGEMARLTSGSINNIEIAVLAGVYLDLYVTRPSDIPGVNQLERFFGLFAKRVDTHLQFKEIRNFASGAPELWDFRSSDLNRVQIAVDAFIHQNYLNQRNYVNRRGNWETELRNLIDQRSLWAEHSAILSAVANSTGTILQEGEPRWLDLTNQISSTNTRTTVMISGDEARPFITITSGEVGALNPAYAIRFDFLDTTEIRNASGAPTIFEIGHQYTGITRLSHACYTGRVADYANRWSLDYYKAKYRFCPQAARQAAIANALIGLIPPETPMAFALATLQVISDIEDERQRLQEIRNDFHEVSNVWALTTVIRDLELLAVVEHNDFGETVFHTWRRTESEDAANNLHPDIISADIGCELRAELLHRFIND